MNRKWLQLIALLGSIFLLAGVMLFAKNKAEGNRANAHMGSTSQTTQTGSPAATTVSTVTTMVTTAAVSTGTTATTSATTAVPTTTSTTAPTQPDDPRVQLAAEYEAYMALSPEEQQAYFLSFSSYTDFFAWFNAAKDAYEALQDRIEIGGDGNVDIGDLIEGNK